MSDINIGYEDIVNTQVRIISLLQLCLISGVQFLLPVGYEYLLFFVPMQVLAFNGKPVKNLKSLAEMVENCDDEYLKFDLEYEQVFLLSPSLYMNVHPAHALVAMLHLCVLLCR